MEFEKCFDKFGGIRGVPPQTVECLTINAGWRRNLQMVLVRAAGRGTQPALQVRTTKTVWFGLRPVQKPDLLPLGGAIPYPYPSTQGYCQVQLGPLVQISNSAFRVFLCPIAFRYCTVNRKVLTLVCYCLFLMLWLPL